jgi:hypothetical protein
MSRVSHLYRVECLQPEHQFSPQRAPGFECVWDAALLDDGMDALAEGEGIGY